MVETVNSGAAAGAGPAPCLADLLDAMRHHEEMAYVRIRHAQEIRERIAKMDADETLRPQYDSPWEKTKDHNLKQADFDEQWGKNHQRWASAICAALNPRP